MIVRSIVPGGVADRDGRLKSGDHILHINDENLFGMSSDAVAGNLLIACICVLYNLWSHNT